MVTTHFGRPHARVTKKGTVRAAAFVAAAASVIALSACSTGGGSATADIQSASKPSGSATSGNISFWASPSMVGGKDMNAVLIQDFEKKDPNVHVKYIAAPQSTNTNQATLTTQISGGGGPDVFLGDVIWPAQFGAHQLASPLSKYLPKSYWDTFAKGLVAGATYKGQVYGAPFFEDQGFLYYRKDILQEDNLPVPKTWQQLVSDSKTAQSKGQVQYGYVFQGADYEGATCDFMEFLTDAGGKVLNSSGTKSALDSSDAIKALTFEQSLVTSGISPKAESTYQETQSMNEFQSGDSLFLRNWDYAYASANGAGSAVVGKVGVAPLPTFSGKPTPGYSNIGGWNLYMNPHSKNQAADLSFIKFMTGTQAQKIIATEFSEIPTIESVRTLPAVVSATPPLAAAAKTKLVARPSYTPNYSQVSQAIYNAVNGVLAGSSTPAQAIKTANTQINTAVSNGGL
jgi:multiple sugar transport system substrate-binding protein